MDVLALRWLTVGLLLGGCALSGGLDLPSHEGGGRGEGSGVASGDGATTGSPPDTGLDDPAAGGQGGAGGAAP